MGGGVVGLTAAQLLQRCGWSIRILRDARRNSRSIAMPEHTWRMVDEIWDCEIARLCHHQKVTGRKTFWSQGEADTDVSVASLSVDVGVLAEALEDRLRSQAPSSVTIEDRDEAVGSETREHVVIDARGSDVSGAQHRSYGERTMHVWPDLPANPALAHHAEVRTGRGYWIFILPVSRDRVSVQIATPSGKFDADEIHRDLSEIAGSNASHLSELVGHGETFLKSPHGSASIAPGISLAAKRHLEFSIGDRAMKFDPICGDGLGQGVKSAILAVAATNNYDGALPSSQVEQHISARHAYAFSAHLNLCSQYYGSIRFDQYWREDVAAAHDGIRELQTGSRTLGTCRLHLVDQPYAARWRIGPRLIAATG